MIDDDGMLTEGVYSRRTAGRQAVDSLGATALLSLAAGMEMWGGDSVTRLPRSEPVPLHCKPADVRRRRKANKQARKSRRRNRRAK